MPGRTWSDDDLRRALPLSGSRRELCRRLGLRGNVTRVPFERAQALGLDISHLTGHPLTPQRVAEKVSDDELAEAVRASSTMVGVLRRTGYAQGGGSHAAVTRRVRRLGLDTSHFEPATPPDGSGWAKRKGPEDIFVRLPEGQFRAPASQLRRALIESGVEERCADCGMGPEWNGRPLRLQVEHRDGDRANCERENLAFLCPNCHAQTSTWGRRPAAAHAGDVSTRGRAARRRTSR